jgi:hypothetical protein
MINTAQFIQLTRRAETVGTSRDSPNTENTSEDSVVVPAIRAVIFPRKSFPLVAVRHQAC